MVTFSGLEFISLSIKAQVKCFLVPGKSLTVNGAAPANVAGREDRLEAWFLGKNCSH